MNNTPLRTLLVALLFFSLAAGCKSAPDENACSDVKVNDTCIARCASVKPGEGARKTICATQVLSRKASQNGIMKSNIKKVQPIKLSQEECFEVENGKIVDAKIASKLEAACGGAAP